MKNKDNAIAKYSRDYDLTWFIRFMFVMAFSFFVGLFVLEVLTAEKGLYLSSEIIHTILGGVIGTGMTQIANHITSKSMQNGNGNGEPEPEAPPEEPTKPAFKPYEEGD